VAAWLLLGSCTGMFDYDELWEPSPDDPRSVLYSDDAELNPDRIHVTARHAIQGGAVKVVLPKKAKFKHIKKALARRLGDPEILSKAQVLDKVNGLYTAYRDRDPVGDVREVMLLGVDLGLAEDSRMVTGLSDGEITEEERDWVTVEYLRDPPKTSPNPVGEPRSRAAVAPGPTSKRRSQQAHQAGVSLGSSSAAISWRMPRARASASSRRPRSPEPAEPVPIEEGPMLTKVQAMNLQLELHRGYTAEDFQEELRLLEQEAESIPRTEFIRARQELFFMVQCQVLPRYGFEDSQEGVYKMMAAMGPFIKDPDFIKMAEKVNEAVGIKNPPERWGSLQKACAKWDYVDRPPGEPT